MDFVSFFYFLLGTAAMGFAVYRWNQVHSLERTVDLTDPAVLLEHWIEQAASLENSRHLHDHIIKHANELAEGAEREGDGSFETWAASMRNLLSIFDTFHGITPNTDLQLARMTAKFLSGTGGSPPPHELPERIVRLALSPAARKVRDERHPKTNYFLY